MAGRTAAATVLTIVVVLLAPLLIADPAVALTTADRALAEAEATLESATEAARQAAGELAEIEQALPAARDRSNAARGALAAARVVADEAVAAADDALAEQQDAEDTYQDAAGAVDDARDALGVLAVSSYQAGPFTSATALLGAGDPITAARRATWIDMLAAQRSTAVDRVVRSRLDARNAANRAVVARQDAEAAAEAAEAAVAAAQTEVDNAQAAEDELTDLLAARQTALTVAEDEKEASLRRYADAKAESERIGAQLRDAGAGHNTGAASGSGFVMPVNGWKSSDFGNRYDPYYQVWQLHAGTDFAAAGGAPIRAAESGTVNQAGWNGGYGNYTCIYHHDNISTCYAHQSRIRVVVGQHVSQGEHIGDVGTTGASTGTHLHFEVRVGGGPVEPLDWLPSCLC